MQASTDAPLDWENMQQTRADAPCKQTQIDKVSDRVCVQTQTDAPPCWGSMQANADRCTIR
eukprot:scaffold238701_cov14-Tisochrysis_lutea.AAC.2